VLSILPTNSPGPLGKVFTDSPIVRMLTFTGSTVVGRHLMRESASTVKKVALELGGNAPFIVFNDADIDKAVQGAMASKFRASGQTCVCANRIFVQSGVYDEFANRLAEKVRALVLGDGFTDEVEIGPLIDGAAVAKVKAHIEQALQSGAVCLVGGKQSDLGGHYFEPTVLSEVTTDMTVARDETFGPVAPLLRFESEGEVVAAANASEYGLAANLFTQDVGTAWRVAERLEYGTVGINTGSMSTAIAPAGGMKQSGIGREGSRYGIDEFVELKYLRLAGIMPARI
jgi:succinate-semialdehyde dehydrogenase/glutarate-semialdehyde dehydrogenase